MKQAFIYSAKVWLTTLVIAPVLAVSITYFIAWYNPVISYTGAGFWVDTYFDLTAGFLLLPLAILFWIAAFSLLKTQPKFVIIKIVLSIVAIIFCTLPFVITGRNLQFSLLSVISTSYWLPSYLLVSVFCIWVYNLHSA